MNAAPSAAVLRAAAGILLESGPPQFRRLADAGWGAEQLANARPDVLVTALARSAALRAAAAVSAVASFGAPDAPPPAAPAGDAAAGIGGAPPAAATPTAAEPPSNESSSPITDGLPTQEEAASAAVLVRRIQVLERKLGRAKQENVTLQENVPSRAARARQNRALGTLRRAEQESAELADRVVALEASIVDLSRQLAAVKAERDEALASRDQAQRSRAALEARLGDVGARADYLRRLLPAETERLAIELAGLPDGKAKTRLRRRAELLDRLLITLDESYPPLEQTPTPAQEHDPAAVPNEAPAPAAPAVHRPLVRVGPSRSWEVLPLGGAEEIGGSAVLVAVGNRRILIDAGIRPNARSGAEMLPRRAAELGDRLDAIIVTHAHADHAGYVPALTDRFRGVPIICSPGTAALLPTMWRDSLTVMTNRADSDAEWMEVGPQPLYSDADLMVAEERVEELAFGRVRRIGDIDLRLFPAGHVLGAAGVVLSADGGRGGRVVITGDISDVRQASVGECELPPDQVVRGADLLVIESTYCHEPLPRREDQVAQLVGEIRDVVMNGRGRVLIPAFALGRAQEIALILAEHLPEVPVLIDGLARQVSRIYELCGREEAARVTKGRVEAREQAAAGRGDDLIPPAEAAAAVRVFTDTVQAVPERGSYRAIRTFNRGVVITTSGMLSGGPAVQWAREILPEGRDALFLCGYQDEEAPGRRLVELCSQPHGQRRTLRLFDRRDGPVEVPVNARVRNYRLSAHADQRGLISVIDRIAANEVMLVHGLRHNQEHFRNVLGVRGQPTVRTADWRRGPQ